jgi:hypothetical protein
MGKSQALGMGEYKNESINAKRKTDPPNCRDTLKRRKPEPYTKCSKKYSIIAHNNYF